MEKRVTTTELSSHTFLQRAYDELSVTIVGLDNEGKLVYANPSAVSELRISERIEDEPISKWLKPFYPQHLSVFKDRLLTWQNEHIQLQVLVSSSRCLELDGKCGWYLVFRDISFIQKKEDLLNYLNEAAEQLAKTRVTTEALDKLSQLIVPRFANWFAIDILRDGKLEQLLLSHEDPEQIKWAEQYRQAFPTDLNSDRGAAGVLKTGTPIFVPQVTPEMVGAAIINPQQLAAVAKMRLRSVITVPLFQRDQICGVITFISTNDELSYDTADLRFAQNLAGHIGLALDNARLNEEAAAEISRREIIEADLQLAQERLRSALSSGLVGTWILDVEQRWLYADENLSVMFGVPYDPNGCPQEYFSQRVHPDDRQLTDEQRLDSISQAKVYESEYRILVEDEVRWCFARGTTEVDKTGKPVRFTGVLVDITKRKKAEVALHESEQRYAAAFKNASVGILLSKPDGTLISSNSAFSRITGYSAEQLAGMNFKDITHPDDLKNNIKLYQRLLTSKIPDFIFEKRYFHADGHVIWVRNSTALVNDAYGKPAYTISITEDITEQKNSQIRLKESEERFRFLADAIPHKLWTSAPDGRATYYNQGWYEYLGGADVEELRLLVWSALHPEDRALAEKAWPEAIRAGKDVAFEQRLRRCDGQYRWHLTRVSPHRDWSGDIRLWVGTSTDIHELKIAQEALESSEAHFKALAELNSLPIWQINANAQSVFVNQAWRTYTGIHHSDIKERDWASRIHPDDRRQAVYDFNDLFAERKPIHLKYRFKHDPSGKYRWMLDNATPVFNPGFYGYIGTMTDIDEQEQARLAVQQLMIQKDEFISVASHELKTPLTTVKAFFQLVKKELSEGHRLSALVEKANNQLNRLERLIEELLDVSRLNAGKMTYHFEDFEFMPLLTECLENARESYPAKDFQLDSEGSVIVFADRHRIEQLLTNLLNNAVKYAPDTQVVKVICRTSEGLLEVAVQDYGIGIAEEHLEHLFERFYRVDGNALQFQGLGLGLFICAEIVRRHGGEIRVESTLGSGSVFFFTLPVSDGLTVRVNTKHHNPA